MINPLKIESGGKVVLSPSQPPAIPGSCTPPTHFLSDYSPYFQTPR